MRKEYCGGLPSPHSPLMNLLYDSQKQIQGGRSTVVSAIDYKEGSSFDSASSRHNIFLS